MKINDWLKPGIKVKRWFFIGIAGVACIFYGLSFIVRIDCDSLPESMLSVAVILLGAVSVYISARYITKTFFRAITNYGPKISLDPDRLSSLLYEKRILIKGPKIVAIGGGTGLSTMLRGLKAYSSNITAVVTVTDDGGGSGILRQDLGILPPGDIRNCVLALADTEPIMEKLLQYRFQDGMLKGQSFGNLFLAAMDGISASFEEAVRKMSDVLAVTGRVLPATLEDIIVCAELDDGHVISGESKISKHNTFHAGRIKRAYLEPKKCKPLQDVIEALAEADIIVLGPGSLYTSIITNLLVEGLCSAIKESDAIKVYVCNIMTQPGETDGYSVYDHIDALEKHSCSGIIDYCIVSVTDIPQDLLAKYRDDGAETVRNDSDAVAKTGIKVIQGDFARIKNNLVRHDPKKLAHAVIELVAEEVLGKDRRRIIDYYYVKDRLKRI